MKKKETRKTQLTFSRAGFSTNPRYCKQMAEGELMKYYPGIKDIETEVFIINDEVAVVSSGTLIVETKKEIENEEDN